MNAATPLPHLDPTPRPRIALPVLSNSEKRSFQSCKRKHYLRYRLLKRPLRSAQPLRFGSALHRGLEAWWRAAKRGEDRLDAALVALRAPATDVRAESMDAFDLAKAEALMVGYHARWAEVVMEVLEVEVEFIAPIINPDTGKVSRTYALGGKIDAIARLDDGLLYVVEHKSSAECIESGSEYWRRLRLDSQVSDYFVGARSLGYDVAGCYYDVIGKPKLSPLEATPPEKRQYTKKDNRLYAGQREANETVDEYRARLDAHLVENVDRYFARGIVVRMDEDEKEAALDTWNTARDIREADLAVRHPRNPDACKGWGQTCEFFAVCVREADVDDPTLFRTAASAHEELSEIANRPTTYEALDL